MSAGIGRVRTTRSDTRTLRSGALAGRESLAHEAEQRHYPRGKLRGKRTCDLTNISSRV